MQNFDWLLASVTSDNALSLSTILREIESICIHHNQTSTQQPELCHSQNVLKNSQYKPYEPKYIPSDYLFNEKSIANQRSELIFIFSVLLH